MNRQTFTDFLTGYHICESCGIVDRDDNRIRVGYPCPRCGIPSKRAMSYFPESIGSIADLIGELYPLPELYPVEDSEPTPIMEESHQFAILVFFCTYGEVLLQHFLQRSMARMSIPIKIQARLLRDNLFTKQRIQKLFPALIGSKWSQVIRYLGQKHQEDFKGTQDFYIRATDKRNQLLHLGNKWAIPRDMAEQCFNHMPSLTRLFIALHNEFLVEPMKDGE